MAPQTPPPGASRSLAALTIASTPRVVMSAIRTTSSSMSARAPRPVPRVHAPPAARAHESGEGDPGGPGKRARRLAALIGQDRPLFDAREDGRIADGIRVALGEGHGQVAGLRRRGQWPSRGLADLDLVAEPVERKSRRDHDLTPAHRDREPADHAPAVQPPVVKPPLR